MRDYLRSHEISSFAKERRGECTASLLEFLETSEVGKPEQKFSVVFDTGSGFLKSGTA